MVSPPKVVPAPAVKKTTSKMVSPPKAPAAPKKIALKPKSITLKKLAPKKLVQVAHGAAAKSTGLKTKMKALLTKKPLHPLKAAAKPLVLA